MPLEACAGVDAGLGQAAPARRTVGGRTAGTPGSRSRRSGSSLPSTGPPPAPQASGPGRSSISEQGPHGPVSPISQKLSSPSALDACAGHADGVRPDVGRLVVVGVHGDPEAVAVEAEALGEQLPGPRDGLGLEVVTEAEVAEHLEEAQVLGRTPDLLDVVVLAADPHALLHRHGAAGKAGFPRPGSKG